MKNLKNPKIVVTVGPASEPYEVLKEIVQSGANIIRVNFSHADHDQWMRIKESLEKIEEETGIETEIMADLQGPRIRLGVLDNDTTIKEGESYTFVLENADFSKNEIIIDYPLYKFVKVGEPLYIWNRSVEMEVITINENNFIAKATKGGILKSRKGINVPKTTIENSLDEKDREDALFASKNGADYMALSFVEDVHDVQEVKDLIDNDAIKIIVKIERPAAVENIDSIMEVADSLIVARGDLGIELPIEDLAIIQKNLIKKAKEHNKEAIVATEMLLSMVSSTFPTRAEAVDVANAIFDGADATMLSEETAVGNHPALVVAMMKKIIQRTADYLQQS